MIYFHVERAQCISKNISESFAIKNHEEWLYLFNQLHCKRLLNCHSLRFRSAATDNFIS